jgi:hypothetical protein
VVIDLGSRRSPVERLKGLISGNKYFVRHPGSPVIGEFFLDPVGDSGYISTRLA